MAVPSRPRVQRRRWEAKGPESSAMASPQQVVLGFLSQQPQAEDAAGEVRAALEGLGRLDDDMATADFNAALTRLCQEGKNAELRKAVVTICLKKAAVSNNGRMSISKEFLTNNFLLQLDDAAGPDERQFVEKLRSSFKSEESEDAITHYDDDFEEEESPQEMMIRKRKKKKSIALTRTMTSEMSMSDLLDDKEDSYELPNQRRAGLSRQESITEEEDAAFEVMMRAARRSSVVVAHSHPALLMKLSAPGHDATHTPIEEGDDGDRVRVGERAEQPLPAAEHKEQPLPAAGMNIAPTPASNEKAPPRLMSRLSQLRTMAGPDGAESGSEEEEVRRPLPAPSRRPGSAPAGRSAQRTKRFGHQPRPRPPLPAQKPMIPRTPTVRLPAPADEQGAASSREVRFTLPQGQEGMVSDDLYELLNKVRTTFSESEEKIAHADAFWRRRLQEELDLEVQVVRRKHRQELKELKLFGVMNIYHAKARSEQDDELQAIRYKGMRTRALNRHKDELAALKEKLQEPLSRLDSVRDAKLQSLNAAAVRADHAMEHCIRSVEAVFGSKRDLFKLRAKTASDHALVALRNSYRAVKAEVAALEDDYKAALRREGLSTKSAPMAGSLRQSLKDYEKKARLVEEKRAEQGRPTSAPFVPDASAGGVAALRPRPRSAATALHARRERGREQGGDECEHYEHEEDVLDIANDDEYDGGFDEFDVEPAEQEGRRVKQKVRRRRKRRRGAKKKAAKGVNADDYNDNPGALGATVDIDPDSRRASSITASEFDKDNFPFFTYPCPHCKQFFRGQGFVMPTHLSLEPPVCASLRQSQKSLETSVKGNPARLTFRQKLSIRYQDYFKKRYSIKPREIDTFCSWECLRSNAKQMVPVKFQYEMFQLIDLAAGYLVN